MEFQDCKEGEITKLDKLISGHVFSEPEQSYEANKVDIVYQDKRIVMDDRVDNLTFLLPKSATITTKFGKYELSITDKLVPSYEGGEERGDMSFGGTFKQLTLKGESVAAGRIHCSVYR